MKYILNYYNSKIISNLHIHIIIQYTILNVLKSNADI